MLIWGRPINVELEELLNRLESEARGQLKESVSRRQMSSKDIFVGCPHLDRHGGVERTPSCSINKDNGAVHCFGCGYTDNLPGYIARVLLLESMIKGHRWILSHYSIPEKGHRTLIPLKTEKKNKDIFLPDSYLEQYNFDHPYMYGRGFTAETIDLFELGYDKSSKSITIPMRDANNRLRFIKKRPIARTKFHKYHIDDGVDKKDLIFGLNLVKMNLERVKMLYLVEGEMDVISMYQSKKYAGGIQGDSLFPEQVKALVKLIKGIPICITTDNDKAGRNARINAIPLLRPYFPLYEPVYPSPRYKDPNDLLKAGLLESLAIKPIDL